MQFRLMFDLTKCKGKPMFLLRRVCITWKLYLADWNFTVADIIFTTCSYENNIKFQLKNVERNYEFFKCVQCIQKYQETEILFPIQDGIPYSIYVKQGFGIVITLSSSNQEFI